MIEASVALRQVCRSCETQMAADPGLNAMIEMVTRHTFGKPVAYHYPTITGSPLVPRGVAGLATVHLIYCSYP